MKKVLQQFEYLIHDLKRWKCSTVKDVFYYIFEQGIWVTILYRIGRAFFLIEIPVIKIALRFLGFILMKFSEVVLGAAIKPGADIGPGLYIGHTGAIRIHPQAKIGKNLNIGTGVIIGEKGTGRGGFPKIGNDVYIGVGAKILGDVNIGNNVKIGANAVVTKDIPAGATAVGVPAKIIKIEPDEEIVS